jgi:hypothetical protein
VSAQRNRVSGNRMAGLKKDKSFHLLYGIIP